MKNKHIAILGGGISGLATAWFLQKLSKGTLKVTIIEKSNRVGGWIETIEKEGFLFENGPRSFRPSVKGLKTLALLKEVGLYPELIFSNPLATKRYVWLNEKLTIFSPLLLVKCGLLIAALKEWRTPQLSEDDESIYDFFLRRFNRSLTENIIVPCIQGIFGGHARDLSIRSCMPFLHHYERTYGSVLRGLWKERKKKEKNKMHALCSFKKGMESLPKAIASQLNSEFLFDTSVEKIHGKTVLTDKGALAVDHIVVALPAHVLPHIFPEASLNLPFLTLTTAHIGFRKNVLNKKGFGYLIPLKEKEGSIGMTWDSEIFPQQNKELEHTRLCMMFRGEKSLSELKPLVANLLKEHLNIQELPAILHNNIAKKAIPQYPVNYFKSLQSLQFPQISFVGNSYGGVSVNDCIDQAETISNRIFASL